MVGIKEALDNLYKMDLYSLSKTTEVSHTYLVNLVDEKFKDRSSFGVYFSTTIKTGSEEINTYVLTKRQLLILTGFIDVNKRCSFVKEVFKMEAKLGRHGELWAKIKKKEFLDADKVYREKREYVGANRSLVNLLLPSIDREFYFATHYDMTRTLNKTLSSYRTPYEVRELMRDAGLLTKSLKSKGEIKEIPNFIELEGDKHHTINSLVYTHTDYDTVLDYMIEYAQETMSDA